MDASTALNSSSAPGGSSLPVQGAAKSLSGKTKCAVAALIIVDVAGALFVALGLLKICGPVGSLKFYASVIGGSSVVLIATSSILLIAICNCKTSSPTKKEKVKQENKVSSYSGLGQQALDFARQKLGEHCDVEAFKFSAAWEGPKNTHQPVNQEIALLTTLYWDVYFKAFENAIQAHQDNPWVHEEVIQAADSLMKMGFAIASLTLEDLPDFVEYLALKGIDRTYAHALAEQDSYSYRTFYYCTNVYHWCRGEMSWGKNEYTDEIGLQYPNEEVSKQHASSFYQEGTLQNDWRLLYNEYCALVRSFVPEKELRQGDNRHANWTKQDTGPKTFDRTPDTLPT